jgi:ribosome assembly protein YihI (activator of Der GTPase)
VRGEALTDQETFVAKPNYHHARKQKELARKARQQEKQQRRASRPGVRGENLETTQSDAATAPPDPTSGGTSGSGA